MHNSKRSCHVAIKILIHQTKLFAMSKIESQEEYFPHFEDADISLETLKSKFNEHLQAVKEYVDNSEAKNRAARYFSVSTSDDKEYKRKLKRIPEYNKYYELETKIKNIEKDILCLMFELYLDISDLDIPSEEERKRRHFNIYWTIFDAAKKHDYCSQLIQKHIEDLGYTNMHCLTCGQLVSQNDSGNLIYVLINWHPFPQPGDGKSGKYAVFGSVVGGCDSRHDMDGYDIAICDDCVEKHKETRMKFLGNPLFDDLD